MPPTTELRKTWGRRVADARKAAGLTQQSLAEQLKISRGYLAYVETGKYAPRDDLRIRLADALGVDPDDLFSLTQPEEAA